jgi:acetyl esterase/lipase
MPLDPSFQTLLTQAATQAQSTPREPAAIVARERATLERVKALLATTSEPGVHVEDHVLPGPSGNIPVRLYKPEGPGPFPVLMCFHGGLAFGDLDTHAPLCQPLCLETGCLVVSVDYRLAPEHPFPAGLEDCYAAPSLAPDLHGLPPALVITAECDPLRDGGEEYGQRLLEVGVPATVSRYEGMVHGFMYMRNLVPQEAHQAFTEATHALRIAFADNKS